MADQVPAKLFILTVTGPEGPAGTIYFVPARDLKYATLREQTDQKHDQIVLFFSEIAVTIEIVERLGKATIAKFMEAALSATDGEPVKIGPDTPNVTSVEVQIR
jgi:hypothetical protein